MLIYTGFAVGENLEKVKEYELGIMQSANLLFKPRKEQQCFPNALDNGAFQFFRRGLPFMESVFMDYLIEVYKVNIELDFIVCPDIVGGGKKSLNFSMDWALGSLTTVPNLALAVQDGMTEQDLKDRAFHKHFTYIFIGGTPDWKWQTAEKWINIAHSKGLKAHIGQCGTLDRLRAAKRMGTDSVDSTNFVRNKSWNILDEFYNSEQGTIDFKEKTK